MDVGLHQFDLTRLLVGDATTLSCLRQRLNPDVNGKDAFTVLVGHAGAGLRSRLLVFLNAYTPPLPQTTAWIEGDRGAIDLGVEYRMTVHGPSARKTYDVEAAVPGWGEEPWLVVKDSSIAFQRHAVAVLEGKAEPEPSGDHNVRTLAMAFAAYKAAAANTVVDLDRWKEAR